MASQHPSDSAAPRLSTSPSYWSDIAMRGYEVLPTARDIGHHARPSIVPALINLAALDDQSGGLPWELDVLVTNAGGAMLTTHRPQGGFWGSDTPGEARPWTEAPSERDMQLAHMPRHQALLNCLADNDLQYAVSAWEDEAGEILTLRCKGMRVALRPGRPNQPTQVIVPEDQADNLKESLKGTRLLARFDPDQTQPRPHLPSRLTHAWLGVTDDLTEVSRMTRLTIPAGERDFYLATLDRLEHFQGDIACLGEADLRRFNAIRHRYLMPEAMLGPVGTEEVHDESYELSALLCMAGAIYRNLDQEAKQLGQATTLDRLEMKACVHIDYALGQDAARTARWLESHPDANEIQTQRIQHNTQLRQGIGAILSEGMRYAMPKATPINDFRLSQAPEKPGALRKDANYGEYAYTGDFRYRSEMGV